MGQPSGALPQPAGGIAPDSDGRAPRADPIAAALLLVAGALGIWQLLLPWRAVTVDPTGSAAGKVPTTGWQVYRLLRAVPDPDGDLRAAM